MPKNKTDLKELQELFYFPDKEIISIHGSGGKSSLLWHIAERHRKLKVLLSSSTKIFLPQNSAYDYFANSKALELIREPEAGIYLCGELPEDPDKNFNRKDLDNPSQQTFKIMIKPLLGLKNGLCAELIKRFDKIILEADGARNRPLKGWEDYEPQILEETSISIGVINISPLGEKIGQKNVHRLEKFCELCGAKEGDKLKPEHLAKVISSPHGLFAKSKGRKILFMNGANEKQGYDKTLEIADKMNAEFRKGLHRIVAGCTRENKGVLVQE